MNRTSWANCLLLLVCIAAPISAEPVVIGETSTIRYNGPEGLVWDFRLMQGDDHGSLPARSTDIGLRMIYPRWRVPRSFFAEPELESD